MASHETGEGTSVDGDAPRTSMDDHKQTYDGFLNLTKWGIIVVVALLVGLAVFLV